MIRSLASLGAGLLVTTVVAEAIEFMLVGILRRDFSPDPTSYFATRNRPVVLGAKMFYNLFAATAGGVAAFLIAPTNHRLHVGGVAALQVLGICLAMVIPSLRNTGPMWMWVSLIPVSIMGLGLGAFVVERTRASRLS